MEIKQTLFKNISISLIANFIDKIFGFIVISYLAKTIGTENFGIWGFASSFAAIIILINRLGTDTLIVREISINKNKAGLYYSNILITRLIFFLFILVSFYLISPFLGKTDYTIHIVFLVLIIEFLMSTIEFNNTFYRAYQRMEFEGLIKIFRAILKISLGIVVLIIYKSLYVYLIFHLAIAIVILVLCMVIIYHKFFKFKLTYNISASKDILKSAFPFLLLGSTVILYSQIDVVMLSFLENDEVTGWYKSARIIFSVFLFIPISFVSAVFPALSENYQNNRQMFIKIYNETLKYLFIIALPIVVGIFILADKFVVLLFGRDYINSVNAIQILILSLIFAFLTPIIGNVLIASRNEKIPLFSAVISAIVNIILNLILIPKFSLYGSCYAALITAFLSFLIQLIFVYIKGGYVQIVKNFTKPVIAIIIMGVVTNTFYELNIFVNIFISAIIYTGCLFFFKSVSIENLQFLKSMIINRDIKN